MVWLARCVITCPGTALQARLGLARWTGIGRATCGLAGQARLVGESPTAARLGESRQGRQGGSGLGALWHVKIRQGLARQAWFGVTSRLWDWLGQAGQGRQGKAGLTWTGQALRGSADHGRRGVAVSVPEWKGGDRQNTAGMVHRGATDRGLTRRGLAWQAGLGISG